MYANAKKTSQPEAKNVAAIREWMKEHRPDLISHLDKILGMLRDGDQLGDGLFLLLSVGFAAGRAYQQKNPKDLEPA